MKRFTAIAMLIAGISAGSSLSARSAETAVAHPVQLPAKEQFHLFLLLGQSNMAGRGTIEPEDELPHPRVLVLSKDGDWRPAVDPLHFDKPVAGVGLGRSFGIQVAESHPGVTVGLIPCAVGGSPIGAWQPGAYYPPTGTHPWEDALRRARLARESGELKGILWHQGESDANDRLAAAYEAKLHDLIHRLRTEFQEPQLPFIAGQMGDFSERPWTAARKRVDQAHRDLPARVPHTAFVSSAGLRHKGDGVHFDAASYREFGKRYFQAYRTLSRGR